MGFGVRWAPPFLVFSGQGSTATIILAAATILSSSNPIGVLRAPHRCTCSAPIGFLQCLLVDEMLLTGCSVFRTDRLRAARCAGPISIIARGIYEREKGERERTSQGPQVGR